MVNLYIFLYVYAYIYFPFLQNVVEEIRHDWKHLQRSLIDIVNFSEILLGGMLEKTGYHCRL